MTFQTLSVPVHGCSVLMSTDWLIVRVPPFLGAGPAASARLRPAHPAALPAAIPAAAPAAVRPVRRSNSRRVSDRAIGIPLRLNADGWRAQVRASPARSCGAADRHRATRVDGSRRYGRLSAGVSSLRSTRNTTRSHALRTPITRSRTLAAASALSACPRGGPPAAARSSPMPAARYSTYPTEGMSEYQNRSLRSMVLTRYRSRTNDRLRAMCPRLPRPVSASSPPNTPSLSVGTKTMTAVTSTYTKWMNVGLRNALKLAVRIGRSSGIHRLDPSEIAMNIRPTSVADAPPSSM